MTSLIRTYGRALTALIGLLAALWVFGMIVAPQITMIDHSFWYIERAGSAAELSQKIDGLYNEVTLLELDRDALKNKTQDEAGKAKLADFEAQIAAKKAAIADLETQENQPRKVYSGRNYTRMSSLHFQIFVKTIFYAALVTLLALIVCYPIAYAVAHLATPNKAALLMLGLIVPYAINELLRIYAWLMILDYQGVLNSFLDWLGLVDIESRQWVPFLEYSGSVFVAMIYAYILFMVFPIYNTVETLDRNQIEAARDLGASTWMIHRRVVIPHAKPGIAVGCIMTFMLSAGSYSVPQIMTRGKGGDWFSQLIYRQFFESNNWNIGSAYAFTLLITCTLFIFLMMAIFRVGIRDIAK
ncbi:MAG: ABC transporter permease [Gammaproteobacteria bacterium]